MIAEEVYRKSDGAMTRAFYADLERLGPAGVVALNLFRAQKCSDRAKKYRGGIPGKGSYRDMAYQRKNWSMDNLCQVLIEHGAALGIRHGWKIDPQRSFHKWVLYVDLPTGQVSFHAERRGAGPDYAGEWDGVRASAERIIAFCNATIEGAVREAFVK